MATKNPIEETSSAGHRAIVNGDGVLRVTRAPASTRVTETRYQAGEVTTATHGADSPNPSLARLVASMQATPILLATRDPDNDGLFWCDADAGFQRWRGDKTARELGAGLGNLGFTVAQRRRLMRATKVGYYPWGAH